MELYLRALTQHKHYLLDWLILAFFLSLVSFTFSEIHKYPTSFDGQQREKKATNRTLKKKKKKQKTTMRCSENYVRMESVSFGELRQLLMYLSK